MAFPTTSLLDDFDRANTGPPPSASWGGPVLPGNSGAKVLSNQLVTAGGSGECYWLTSFGPDSECYITIGTLGTGFGLYLRVNNPNTGTMTGYYADIYANTIDVYRMDNAGYNQLGASIATTTSAGDTFGLEMIGATLTVYRKPSAGAWGSIGSRTDATYGAAGAVGVLLGSANLDNFGGGTVTTGGTTYTDAGSATNIGTGSGAGVAILSDAGSAQFAATASGSDAATAAYLDTGSAASSLSATGTGIAITADAGSGILRSVATGSDANAYLDTGGAASAWRGTGADAAIVSDMGSAVAALFGFGTDVAVLVDSGSGVLIAIGAGADVGPVELPYQGDAYRYDSSSGTGSIAGGTVLMGPNQGSAAGSTGSGTVIAGPNQGSPTGPISGGTVLPPESIV